MKTVLVLHNPKAGEEDHQRKELIHKIRSAGYNCMYASIRKRKWKRIDEQADILLIVGGDGTVREVIRYLIGRTLLDKRIVLSLLPMGTANNIALTLKLSYTIRDLVAGWEKGKLKKIDVGAVKTPSFKTFFLEGMGYGILPKLMREMELLKTDHLHNTDEELRFARHTLLNLAIGYQAKRGILEADGKQIQDSFLLIEIMNTTSIGPNLLLAPNADIGDGIFEIAYVTASQRDEFVYYLHCLLTEKPAKFPGKTFRGKKIEIKWEGRWAHADDQLVQLKKGSHTTIVVREEVFDFLLG